VIIAKACATALLRILLLSPPDVVYVSVVVLDALSAAEQSPVRLAFLTSVLVFVCFMLIFPCRILWP
jgi:hypothetical protein